MENKAHALAAGIFVLGVTALLIALAVWLTRDGGVRQTYALSTPSAVTGLQPQASVRFKGVLVGKVTDIGFDPQTRGHVLILIAVDRATPVTASTFATLGYQGVTGLAFVQLDDGGESPVPLGARDGEPPRIPLRPGFVERLSDQGGQVLAQVEEASRRLNQLLAPENQTAVLGAVASAGQAANGVRQLATEVDRVLKTQLDPRQFSLPQLAQDTRATLQSLQATSEQTRLAVQRLSEQGGVIDKLDAGGEALAQGAGTLNASTLPRLQRMTDGVALSARQVGRAASKLSENPQVLLYGGGAAQPGPGEPGFTAPNSPP